MNKARVKDHNYSIILIKFRNTQNPDETDFTVVDNVLHVFKGSIHRTIGVFITKTAIFGT